MKEELDCRTFCWIMQSTLFNFLKRIRKPNCTEIITTDKVCLLVSLEIVVSGLTNCQNEWSRKAILLLCYVTSNDLKEKLIIKKLSSKLFQSH